MNSVKSLKEGELGRTIRERDNTTDSRHKVKKRLYVFNKRHWRVCLSYQLWPAAESHIQEKQYCMFFIFYFRILAKGLGLCFLRCPGGDAVSEWNTAIQSFFHPGWIRFCFTATLRWKVFFSSCLGGLWTCRSLERLNIMNWTWC